MICYTIVHWWQTVGGMYSYHPTISGFVFLKEAHQTCRLCKKFRTVSVKYSKRKMKRLESEFLLYYKPLINSVSNTLNLDQRKKL